MRKARSLALIAGLSLASCITEERFIIDEKHPMKYDEFIDAKGAVVTGTMIYDTKEKKYVIYLGGGITFEK